MKTLYFTAAAAALLLGACTVMQPANPALSGSWQDIGTSPNGNVGHAIDTASIRSQNHTATFRERITVRDPAKEHYINTPRYKYSLNEWQMDCRARTYRLLSVQMFDAGGNLLAAHRYTNLRAQPVVKGSASGNQFEKVCRQAL